MESWNPFTRAPQQRRVLDSAPCTHYPPDVPTPVAEKLALIKVLCFFLAHPVGILLEMENVERHVECECHVRRMSITPHCLPPVRPVSVAVTSSTRSPRPGVFEVRTGTEITLTCDVTEAKPAATVRWQRNGVTIQPGRPCMSNVHTQQFINRVGEVTVRNLLLLAGDILQ